MAAILRSRVCSCGVEGSAHLLQTGTAVVWKLRELVKAHVDTVSTPSLASCDVMTTVCMGRWAKQEPCLKEIEGPFWLPSAVWLKTTSRMTSMPLLVALPHQRLELPHHL